MSLMKLVCLCFALMVLGCDNSSSKSAETTPKTSPISAPTAALVAEPVDAVELAAQIKFPLMPNPVKAPVATKQDKGNGEMRYEIVQVVKETPKEAADFYAKKLGVNPVTKPDGFELDGQANNGSFMLMSIQQSNGKTVVGAKLLQMTANKAK